MCSDFVLISVEEGTGEGRRGGQQQELLNDLGHKV